MNNNETNNIEDSNDSCYKSNERKKIIAMLTLGCGKVKANMIAPTHLNSMR